MRRTGDAAEASWKRAGPIFQGRRGDVRNRDESRLPGLTLAMLSQEYERRAVLLTEF